MKKYRVPLEFEAESDEQARAQAARALIVDKDVASNAAQVAVLGAWVVTDELQVETTYWRKVDA
jgi:hypothetical protein